MFVALLLAAAAPPAEPPMMPLIVVPSRAADPVTLAAAERLLDAIDYQKTLDATIETMIVGQRQRLREDLRGKVGDEVPQELLQQIGAIIEESIRETVAKNGPGLRKAVALAYAQYFTAADLDRLTEINRDPVMKKSMAVVPMLANDMMTLSHGMFQQAMPEIREKIEAAVSSYKQANPS